MRFRWFSAALLLLAAGCSSDPTKPVVQAELTPNDTPEHAVQRFVEAYEQKRAGEFAAMFTQDFVFEFSPGTCPDLVAKYPAGWYKTDEFESASHLFSGYSAQGLTAASTIDLTLTPTTPSDDDPSGDPARRKVLVARVDGTIVIPPSRGSTESVTI